MKQESEQKIGRKEYQIEEPLKISTKKIEKIFTSCQH